MGRSDESRGSCCHKGERDLKTSESLCLSLAWRGLVGGSDTVPFFLGQRPIRHLALRLEQSHAYGNEAERFSSH